MKFSNSIIFSTLLGIASIGLITEQAQALTTFADANSTDFTDALALDPDATPYTFDFDSLTSGSAGVAALSDGSLVGTDGQTLTITADQSNFQVARKLYAALPFSGDRQVGFDSPNNGTTSTITFTFSQPTTYFGIHIGDQFDINDTSGYTLSVNGGSTILPLSSNSLGGSTTAGFTFPITANDDDGSSESLTVGNNAYNFFGITDATPFTQVTLTMTDQTGNNEDNFVFDSIIVNDDATAAVPFEFSPSLGLILVGLGFGGYKYRQTKLNNKDLS